MYINKSFARLHGTLTPEDVRDQKIMVNVSPYYASIDILTINENHSISQVLGIYKACS